MTDREWNSVALLLERGFKWREPFGTAHERAYRALLDGYEASDLALAIRKLVAGGQVFGPAPGELIAAIERDDSRPIFIEAFDLIHGHGGVLRARAPRDREYWDEPEMLRARDEAALDRAWAIHPLLGAFVQSYGVDRLRMLEVEHDERGGIVRRDLEQAWDKFVEANAHRDAAALASGRRRQLTRGPQRFDPGVLLQSRPGDTPNLPAVNQPSQEDASS